MNVTDKPEFVFVVNNLSGYKLRRTGSAGSHGNWPLGDIDEDMCFAAVVDRTHISVAVQYTAVEARPGVQAVALAGAKSKHGRSGKRIGIFPGKSAKYAWEQMPVGFDFTDKHGNRALIREKLGGYIYVFEIKSLGYEQVAVKSGDNAVRSAVDLLVSQEGKMPRSIFVVNNQSGYDLTCTGKVRDAGTWPLGDVRKGECVAGGCGAKNMSVAVQYAAHEERDDTQDASANKLTIALAAGWPMIGNRRVAIYKGKSAQFAWENMPVGSDFSGGGDNRAMIQQKEGSCIFTYDIKQLDYEIVPAGFGAAEKAVDLLISQLGRMPDFVFVVNNQTDCDLRRTGSAGNYGSWPLPDIKKQECLAGGLDRYSMSLAVEYSADPDRTISLAGSWPRIGYRKIGIFRGSGAQYAWDHLSRGSIHNDDENEALIRKERGGYIYQYWIKNI